jgi:SAM-dependent methyltransferase
MTNASNACYLCSQSGLEVLTEFSWLVKCRNCGIIYNPDLSINSQEISNQFYDELNVRHRKRIQSVLRRVAHSRWQWLIKRIGGQPGCLLEIGCGTGEFLLEAKNAGWQVEGLELSAKFREAAKYWYGFDLQAKELSQANISLETIDVVALLHVFEHLPDPIATLDEIYQILKPGGWLLIIIPNVSSWTDSLFGKASPVLLKQDHLFHYNPKTLHMMVERSKLGVMDMTTFEPSHHIWTSLYGHLSAIMKKRNPQVDNSPEPFSNESFMSILLSNLPYWMGTLSSLFLYPFRLWLQKGRMGHEIYLLCRRSL